jgi:hypothetical protein
MAVGLILQGLFERACYSIYPLVPSFLAVPSQGVGSFPVTGRLPEGCVSERYRPVPQDKKGAARYGVDIVLSSSSLFTQLQACGWLAWEILRAGWTGGRQNDVLARDRDHHSFVHGIVPGLSEILPVSGERNAAIAWCCVVYNHTNLLDISAFHSLAFNTASNWRFSSQKSLVSASI